MSKLHIKKGDKVKVLAGESKGEEGRIIKVYPAKNTAIVEGDGIKKAKKHTKPNAANPQGGIVQQDIPIHISNLAVIDAEGNVTRIGRREEDGKLVRYSKKSGEVIK
jgi:large subunit ribosomal protein L24